MSNPYIDKACNALPQEVLAVLPLEGHQQIELAHSITCYAYAEKVSKLEAQADQLQSSLLQSQQTVKSLERRLSSMETELLEHQQRARQALTEQHKLMAEKNALIETVKRLNREVAKLEHFKRNLLQQLQDDTETEVAGPTYAVVDMTTERLVSEVLHSADGIAAAAAAAAAAGANSLSGGQYSQQHQQHQHHQQQQQHLAAGGSYQQRQSQEVPGGQRSWSPTGQGGAGRLQGVGSPRNNMYASIGYAASAAANADSGNGGSSGGSPYRSMRSATSAAKEAVLGSKAGIPAAATTGTTSAGGVGLGGAGVRSPTAAAAAAGAGSTTARGLAAAANMAGPRFSSPPHAAAAAAGGRQGVAGRPGASTSPRVDGKEFFRQARARLSYEQFSQFLVAIKDLNAGRSSREDTLGAAKALFGASNRDLYDLFEGLLMRHLTTF